MTLLGGPFGRNAEHVRGWEPQADGSGDLAAERARALAHASLVQTSLKVANIRAAVVSRLLDARTEAEEIVEAAQAEAEQIRRLAHEDAEAIHEQALIEARRNTIRITDRALDRRDVLIISTVEKLANLSTSLLGMSDQIIANAQDKRLAEHQLANFMLALTEMVPEFGDVAVSHQAAEDDEPDTWEDAGSLAA